MSMNGSVLSPLRRESSYITDLKATSRCMKLHLNNLWSIWYGISIAALNLYIVTQCSKRYFDFEDFPWLEGSAPSISEFRTCVGLTAVAALLLPFFLTCTIFKVGNLANDGFKLGRSLSTCSADPPAGVAIAAKNGCHRLWQHCGPTACLFHLVISFCVLVPKLIMESRLIQSGFLPRDMIWKTDLDFLIQHYDPLVTLNFTPSSHTNYIASNYSEYVHQNISGQPRSMALAVVTGQEFLIEDNTNFGAVSIEFLNYALALFIYAIRYPSVFWATNKYFGILFSLQLLVNTVQCLLMHVGVCILYKIHVVGSREVLPYLTRHLGKWALRFGKPFILNKEVTLALYVMSIVLILISSLVLYLYGYGRLNSFLNREQARRVISLRYLQSGGRTWGYFTHCVALCVLVAIAACEGPLLYDFSLIYRGSLDLIILIVILSSILHLFLWVFLWLILTLKQHWEFKLRITIGHATVRSARSIKLVTDVNLVSSIVDQANAPLLVVGHGKTYTISETQSKRAIMTVIQKATLDKKIKAGQVNGNKVPSDDGEEQIYWLRPKSRTPRHSPDSSSSESTRFGWFTRKRTHDKNTVDEMEALTRKQNRKIGMIADDEGDYVRLREIQVGVSTVTTPRGEHSDDTTSEDNKLLECVRNDSVTYASVNKELLNPGIREFEDPNPLLTSEHEDHDDLPPPPPELSMGFLSTDIIHNHIEHRDFSKCLHHSDSGMAAEELPSHSGSEVSGGSPPDRTCSNSETSSGIHSNSSGESGMNRNCNSNHSAVNFLGESTQKIQPQQWLQRNIQLPSYSSNRIYKPQQHYAVANKTPSISEVGEENTVVIMRKNVSPVRAKIGEVVDTSVDRFGRSTNMRMTSFTDHSEATKCSATLPHYPTQPIGGISYPHCSTMPLPISNPSCNMLGNGNSCGSFHHPHTTIPTHHNGIRLCNPQINNVYSNKSVRMNGIHAYLPEISQTHTLKPSHHTFPQAPMHPSKYYLQRNTERDSANFSIASSGDSDICNNNGTAVS